DQPQQGQKMMDWKLPGGLHSFHRAQLLEMLGSHVPSSVVNFNAELDHYQRAADGTVALFFKNGNTVSCDVLVGADGLWSTVRHQMYKELRGEVHCDPDPK